MRIPCGAGCSYCTATHDGEKSTVYPEETIWTAIDNRAEYQRRYPYVPERILDNLPKPEAKVSVAPWSKIEQNPEALRFLVNATYADRQACSYDLSRSMRRANS